jgi:biofilm PGA synthesis protein PgaA
MNTYNMRLTNDDSDLAKQQQAVAKAKLTNATYIAELEKGTHTSKDINNAYSDQIRLDYLSKDYNKVINSYRKIQKTAPSYILNEVSSALLAQKHPLEALAIAKEQIAKEPKSFSALSNAYYASLELEDFYSAQSYLDTLDKVIPVWFYSEDGKRSVKNPKRETLELMKVMHVAYQNKLPQAEAGLFDLVSKAPGNNEYRANLATIYRWRGWFDKSQEELNIIENSDSGYLLKDITQTYLDMDQQEFTKAAQAVASISENYPDSDQTKQLLKNWNLANRNLLSVSARQANPKGSTFSSRDQTIGIEWISQPFANHWRSLTFTEHSAAKFGNQHGQITKFGTGLNYRHNWGDVTAKIFKVQDSQGMDASLAGTWLINDYFFMHAGLQSFSDQTPVRAFDSGVSASSYIAGITYRPHELKEFSLSSEVANFSDGNARFSASAKAVRNLYRDQHSNLDLSGFLYWQGNESDTNRNYFNPKSIWSVSSALEFEKLIYRYYEKSLSHNVRLEIGQVTQHAFDSELFYSLDYFQRLQFSNALAITYGFGYASTYYDGLNEKGPKINFGLEYKF